MSRMWSSVRGFMESSELQTGEHIDTNKQNGTRQNLSLGELVIDLNLSYFYRSHTLALHQHLSLELSFEREMLDTDLLVRSDNTRYLKAPILSRRMIIWGHTSHITSSAQYELVMKNVTFNRNMRTKMIAKNINKDIIIHEKNMKKIKKIIMPSLL